MATNPTAAEIEGDPIFKESAFSSFPCVLLGNNDQQLGDWCDGDKVVKLLSGHTLTFPSHALTSDSRSSEMRMVSQALSVQRMQPFAFSITRSSGIGLFNQTHTYGNQTHKARAVRDIFYNHDLFCFLVKGPHLDDIIKELTVSTDDTPRFPFAGFFEKHFDKPVVQYGKYTPKDLCDLQFEA
ncbi:hypothetical protein ACN38_g8160 [Penicillium nordicum]|uniref:Uncharacterized protein n=1 Tax=Penicillium nordicum TaxID=229535 RepID=A0A0M8P5R0_9EURO|nr:hypothetical protein ACN38_g8160 [Penicillium nordicum]